jgi:hypothetical protein
MSTLELENIKHENSSSNNLVLDSDGNVGIGMSSPNHKLQVLDQLKISSSDQSSGSVMLGDGSSSNFKVGIGRWNGSTNAAGAGGVGYFAQGSTNAGGHFFYTGDASAGSTTERMRIDASGNVSTPNTVFAPQYNRGTVASSTPMGTIIFHDNEVSNVNRSISNHQTTWTDALSKVVTPQSANSYFWVEFYHNEHINTQTPNYGGGLRLIGDTGGVDTEIARGGEMKYRTISSTIPPYNGNAKTWGSWYNPTTASNITFRAQVTGSTAQTGGNNYYYHWASSYIANQRGPRLRIVEFT